MDGVSTAFPYDTAGRLVVRTDTVDGLPVTVLYAYDTLDNLTRITYPSGREVGYTYDTQHRITRVFNVLTDATYADQFTYHPSGALASYRAGNGVTTTLTYDPNRLWLDTVQVGASGSVLSLDYGYDGVGNITGIADGRSGMSQTFAYDVLDRLTHADGFYGPLTYTYDAHGNRQTQNGVSLTYHAGSPFHLQSIGGAHALVYDHNGNLTGGFGAGHSYGYTPDNLLRTSSVGGTTTHFAYDVDAWRLKKAVDGGATHSYVRGPHGQLLTEMVGGATPEIRDYVHAGGRLLAMIPTSGAPGGGSLPSGWSGTDIGAVGVPGSASEAGGTFTLSGAGADIWGYADGLQFVARPLTGDGTIVARVASLQAGHEWAKAGVMMRETLAAGSTHAFAMVTTGHGFGFQRRTTTDDISSHTAGGSGTAPVWVRLTREGATFSASTSADGTAWTVIGTETTTMAATIYVGLAVTSHDTGVTAVATFDSVTVTTPGGGTALPPGWTSGDVGAVGLSGSTTYDAGTFTVTGAGADIWGDADGFQFVARPLTGDGTIVARVASLQAADAWAKAGVMMRESLATGARHAFAMVTAGHGVGFQRRTTTDDISSHTGGGPGTAPQWVRLTREGTTVSAYRSADGTAWTLMGSETLAMGSTISVGLAVTSHDTGATGVATFDSVTVTADGGTGLPAGWDTADVGSVGVTGAASYTSGTFAVTGSGDDIWYTADGFRYVYRAMTGDGTVTARVSAVDYVDEWTKAGVMIRESLAAGSRHAFMAVTPGNGLAFQRRVTPDGISDHTAGAAVTAPVWVRLTRTGDTVSGYSSADGTAWTFVGSDTVSMTGTISVGLAVTSHDHGAAATATFDHVEVP